MPDCCLTMRMPGRAPFVEDRFRDRLAGYPNRSAYVARGEARPAYKRAFDAPLAIFTGKAPVAAEPGR